MKTGIKGSNRAADCKLPPLLRNKGTNKFTPIKQSSILKQQHCRHVEGPYQSVFDMAVRCRSSLHVRHIYCTLDSSSYMPIHRSEKYHSPSAGLAAARKGQIIYEPMTKWRKRKEKILFSHSRCVASIVQISVTCHRSAARVRTYAGMGLNPH